jgi:uncharacterized Ntn-hydrolase superfamily protein
MTFSLVVRDISTGAFGIVLASSSPAVAARCMHLRPGVGAVASQNVTNPALGQQALDALAGGASAPEALDSALATERHPAYRQLVAVDVAGRTAVRTGANALGIHGSAERRGAAGAGNLLAHLEVIEALLDGFASSTAPLLEERMLDGLDAAVAAGGEAGPLHSAGLGIVEDVAWATTDLRVDWSDSPSRDLRRLWDAWARQKHDYRTRALDPTQAPSYGVPGDE